MNPDIVTDAINIGIALGLLYMSRLWYTNHEAERRLAWIPAAIYGLHLLIFYIFLLVSHISNIGISELIGIDSISRYWSVVLRIHSGSTMILILVILHPTFKGATWTKLRKRS